MKRSRAAGSRDGKSKRAKKNDKSSCQPRVLTDDEIDDILESVATGQSELSVQNETINKLKKQVDDLQTAVVELKSQVSLLQSALGWTLKGPTTSKNQSRVAPTTSTGQSDADSGGSSASGGPSTSMEVTTLESDESSTSGLFTEVASRRRQSNAQRATRDAVVAAVYVDQQRKNDRVNNLVVSGLQPLPNVNDKTVVSDLIRTEIGITPDIVLCRRLGQITTGKVQPLLVVLRTASQADDIFAQAKNLRKSAHSVVKERVFINRHLTDAQARAAYEMRCQRREVAKHRSHQKTVTQQDSRATDSMKSSDAVDAAAVSAAAAASFSLPLSSSTTSTTSGLSAAAAVFAPTTSN